MTHKEEVKELFKNFLKVHCFNYWSGKPDTKYRHSLEIEISPTCNTKCSYCYYKNFQEQLYPSDINKFRDIIDNCRKLFDWIVSENYKGINSIEIFSGEFFNLPYYKEILDIIADANKRMGTHIHVVVPTNATFCLTEEKTKEIQEVFDYYKSIGTPIFLSMSIDGLYLDNDTRALRNGKLYTEDYYTRAFTFGNKNGLSYHPMVGAKGIEKWKDNFDWYINQIRTFYNISEREAYKYIYLLEVRNPDWTESELKEYYDFIYYLVKRTYKFYKNPEEYFNKFILTKYLNLFSSYIGWCGRGMGCSIQSTFMVRLGDLSLVPCHRTSYSNFVACKLRFTDDNKLDLDLVNPETYMMVQGFDSSTCSVCSDCPINKICNKFCLGCNYEINKDFFIPVTSVCKLEWTRAMALTQGLKDTGVLNYLDSLSKKSRDTNLRKQVSEIMNIKNNYLN